MTKAQELAVLDTAIQALGRDSYLGPWLASVRAEVEQDIRSDIAPSTLPAEAYRHGEEITRIANLAAERTKAEAAGEAQKILQEASNRVLTYKAAARGQLERLAREL